VNSGGYMLDIVDTELVKDPEENSIVCYCYRLTTGELKAAYNKLGSLKAVEQCTRAGTACTGCKIILQSLFNETPTDGSAKYFSDTSGSTCLKPGNKIMKGFVIADGNLESRVFSSNGVAPQLGNCDSTTPVDWALLNHKGEVVAAESTLMKTNETFVFDTRKINIIRPFYGMFFLSMQRSNFGASRFYISWSNEKSTTSTHENATSGRMRIFLPLKFDTEFLNGPTSLWLAIINPHQTKLAFQIHMTDASNEHVFSWRSELEPFGTAWLDGNSSLIKSALSIYPNAKFSMRIETEGIDVHKAIVSYFFLHNKVSNTWTSNHL
jgi:BFD-like [2Fe-2S] binding domain